MATTQSLNVPTKTTNGRFAFLCPLVVELWSAGLSVAGRGIPADPSGQILTERSKMILSETILCGESLIHLKEQTQFTTEQGRH